MIFSLLLPDTINLIGEKAFYGCKNLNGMLHIPKTISLIGSYAFAGCSGLTGRIKIPETMNIINEGLFHNCSCLNGNLTLNQLTRICNYSFKNTNFERIEYYGVTSPQCELYIGFDENYVIYTEKNYEDLYFCKFNISKILTDVDKKKKNMMKLLVIILPCAFGTIALIVAGIFIYVCVKKISIEGPSTNPTFCNSKYPELNISTLNNQPLSNHLLPDN
ncbi:hypothetical protein M9Y10_042973 [Tritrichomonas musculus]|uniref:Surface antigen BspA-like n=1 Tax=Tritrichomonas musculus TaxID=1915356 RepID=A0ABR2JZ21_9EUKA